MLKFKIKTVPVPSLYANYILYHPDYKDMYYITNFNQYKKTYTLKPTVDNNNKKNYLNYEESLITKHLEEGWKLKHKDDVQNKSEEEYGTI